MGAQGKTPVWTEPTWRTSVLTSTAELPTMPSVQSATKAGTTCSRITVSHCSARPGPTARRTLDELDASTGRGANAAYLAAASKLAACGILLVLARTGVSGRG